MSPSNGALPPGSQRRADLPVMAPSDACSTAVPRRIMNAANGGRRPYKNVVGNAPEKESSGRYSAGPPQATTIGMATVATYAKRLVSGEQYPNIKHSRSATNWPMVRYEAMMVVPMAPVAMTVTGMEMAGPEAISASTGSTEAVAAAAAAPGVNTDDVTAIQVTERRRGMNEPMMMAARVLFIAALRSAMVG
eukprot:scaffold309290_cov30-Tisochrysis_lutea.AAC.1